jgi:murein DD-endopeptidase MepM/ murein hydrolase activator NlpD
VLLLCGLLAPGAALSAGPRDRRDRAEASLKAVRTRIARHRREALSVRDRIDLLGHRITSVQIVINKLDVGLSRVRSRVYEARARVELLESKMSGLRAVAIEQAIQLYKSGAVDGLDALLGADSIAELGSRIDLLEIAAEHNSGALVRYGRLRSAIRFHHHDLFAREAQLDTIRDSRAGVLRRRRALEAELQGEFLRLRRRVGYERAREGRLVRASRRLKRRIVAAQAEHSVRILGISSRGFVWPLNGPVTSPFGERWGRLHTGIDINGYTGQPIVAAKDGVVILASSSMSGYGQAIVLDHGGGISTLYGHMSGYALRDGLVRQGQIIGYVGCTGNCYGDHLHFEVRINGNPVDPISYLP